MMLDVWIMGMWMFREALPIKRWGRFAFKVLCATGDGGICGISSGTDAEIQAAKWLSFLDLALGTALTEVFAAFVTVERVCAAG